MTMQQRLESVYNNDDDIQLGSFQYGSIQKRYTIYNEDPSVLPEFYREIVIHYRDEFQAAIRSYMTDIYRKYENTRLKKRKELTPQEHEEFFFDIYTPDEAWERLHSVLKPDPFKFPVKPHLDKIAIMEYAKYRRNSSWDLWTLCDNLRLGILGNLMHLTTDKNIQLISNSETDAALIYCIKDILDLEDRLIEDAFGDFDT